MKVIKIVHWTSTIIFSAFFLMSVYMYLSQNPQVQEGLKLAGFPPFLLGLLGTAKLLGVIALLQPRYQTLKEWAYAGFTINLIGAVWTHAATRTPFTSAIVFMVILAVSYISWKKMLSAREVRKVAYA
ncbi:MAG: DoxX family protein [Flavipsychrobacter sp.]|nr:DoxX family protein [Flavipsychrobacter sp.]